MKGRTFFFANYEGLRQQLTVPISTVVPDANFRNGILPCAQAPLFPCDVSTGQATVGVNPNIKSILDTYPVPNGKVLGNGTAFNASQLKNPVSENYFVIKLDHTFTPSDSITASYVFDNANLTAHPQPVLDDNDKQRNQYFTVEERKVISPTFFNVAHFSYVRSNINVATQNVPSLSLFTSSQFPGTIQVAGLSTIGGNDNAGELLSRFTGRDQVSLTKGRHSISVAMEAVRHLIDASIPIVNGGVVVYNPIPLTSTVILPSFENFLTNTALAFAGVPSGGNDSSRQIRHWNFSPYVQDKFQVSRRLVLNLGLRYDYETNPIEVHDKLYNLVNPFTDAGFSKVPHAFKNNPTVHNFEPRVGFAWDVFGDQKTSLRGGFGAFADLPLEMQVQIAYLFNPPLYNVQTILLPTIPNPFGGGGTNITGLPGGAQLTAYDSPMNDYIMQYNLNLQHDFGRNSIFTVGYLGSRANHLYIGQETNACLPTSVLPVGTIVRNYANSASCPTVNPKLSNNVIRYPVGTSNYNSLQVSLDRAMGSLVQFRTAYTYSKCLDYGSYYTGNDSIGPNGQTFGLQTGSLANIRRNIDYGPCDYDLRHNWTNNVVLALPFHGNRLKEGWLVSTILSLHSGTPFSVYDAIDQANVGQAGAAANGERPNLAPGARDSATGLRITSVGPTWFDPNAFQLQPMGVFGNLGRNTLTGQGVFELDFQLAKNLKLSEKMSLQLRAEAFNLTNHTNFGFPNAALYTGVDPMTGQGIPNPAAGSITSTTTTSRQLQFSAKFTF